MLPGSLGQGSSEQCFQRGQPGPAQASWERSQREPEAEGPTEGLEQGPV